MKSAGRGTRISGAEVTNVSANGIWLLIDERELFLAFEKFPWFELGTIRQITRVERPSAGHLYWPELDIDLALESLEHPEAYPLVSKARPKVVAEGKGSRQGRRAVGRRGGGGHNP